MQRVRRVILDTLFLFARHGGQTQPASGRRHPDQGEDNPNRKGVAGNGRV